MKYIKAIQQIELLSMISPEAIQNYLNEGSFSVESFGRNSVVHYVGDYCDKVEIILSGVVVIDRIAEDGKLMTITDFFQGDILGGNLLFSKNPYYPMTISAKRESVILKIDREKLTKLFQDNHEFLIAYLTYVSDHAKILSDRLCNYVHQSIRERISHYLLQEYNKHQSTVFPWNMTKKELAERIGAQRTSLSRELAKMRADDWIEYDAKTVELKPKFFNHK